MHKSWTKRRRPGKEKFARDSLLFVLTSLGLAIGHDGTIVLLLLAFSTTC